MVSKAEILSEFSLFSVPTGGIGNWLTEDTHDHVFARLGQVDHEPLPAVQLNQLLVLRNEAPAILPRSSETQSFRPTIRMTRR